MTENDFIVCEGLVKIYKVANLEVVALQGLDLSVARGEMLGIVGASGSGKTTLMNILGGLDRPSAGKVRVDGRDLLTISSGGLAEYRRTKVGFVWQQGERNLIPYLSALDNVRLPIILSGRGWWEERARAEALLAAVGLAERLHHRLMELSGGEQQRVAIAVSLANNPSLLLADEPTGEVDTTTAAGIFKVFQELNRQFQLTTLIVSHDSGLGRYVDRVIAIRDGKTSSETFRQVLTPASEQVGVHEKAGAQEEEMFEELVLLDSAGRLQVPREYLEKFNIKSRAQLEVIESGILIRPAQAANQNEAVSPLASELEATQEPHGMRGWWKRLRRESQRKRQ
jgi:ABC-type lipoprotein export system ATPase subunit/bifunctional DNA-binding transcriptional regulator/antitoxin component of YhaV-PrlF toxin-antitoxin module